MASIQQAASDVIFVLDFYSDAIKRTTRLKWERRLRDFPATKSECFSSLDEALDAMILRAAKALEAAKDNVRWAEKRLTKCRKYHRARLKTVLDEEILQRRS
jgi:hypothetical protein